MLELAERVAKVEAVQASVGKKLDEIHADVRSLIESRAERRGAAGALKWLAMIAGGVGAAVVEFVLFLVARK